VNGDANEKKDWLFKRIILLAHWPTPDSFALMSSSSKIWAIWWKRIL